jgi:hypothetical protein
MKKFAASLTNAQITFCRKVEAAGLASYSQAVKAFERGENDKIATWKAELAKRAEF